MFKTLVLTLFLASPILMLYLKFRHKYDIPFLMAILPWLIWLAFPVAVVIGVILLIGWAADATDRKFLSDVNHRGEYPDDR